jgi:hypothetical protein
VTETKDLFTSLKFKSFTLALIVTAYVVQIASEGTHNMSYYVLWTKSIAEGRLLEIYHATPESLIQNSDSLTVPYTPLSQYLTSAMSWLVLKFLPDERASFVISVNLTCVLFTFLTALCFYRTRKKLEIKSPLFFLATPAVILISPILGYEDSIMSFFLVAMLISVNNQKYFVGGLLAGCAVLSKQLTLMPVVAIFLLILYSKKLIPVFRFLSGAAVSACVILSPFILSGSILLYFKAQGLTSVHTMLSAQAANFPWLGSLLYRISELGFIDGFIKGGNGLRISNDQIRQISYLGSGIVTILVFVTWAIYWGRKVGAQNIDLTFGAAIMSLSYHLFNFGVHENHIYMLIPTLFLLSNRFEVWKIYKLAGTALTVSLVSAYGFGGQSRIFNGFSSTHPELFTAALGASLILYSLAFLQLIFTNPRQLQSPSNAFIDKLQQ